MPQKQSHLQFDFSPVNNQHLAYLCGPLDENLRQIEQALSVRISHRGEHFSVLGDPKSTEQTRSVLHGFYTECMKIDKPLMLEDIQLGLIQLNEENTADHSLEEAEKAASLITLKPGLRTRTAKQATYLQCIHDHDITIGIGPAGTGKTYLAVAAAVDAFERDLVERIILTRPAVEAGERLGFLPGDLSQKVDPYLRPLYDALYELMGFDKVLRLIERGVIEVAPLAFMRGRTLNRAFIILDEAQNTTQEQMKMFLTRIGLGAKAVVNGDLTQTDLPKGSNSGLRQAYEVLQQVQGVALVQFGHKDVVRHPLVARIVKAYEQSNKTLPKQTKS